VPLATVVVFLLVLRLPNKIVERVFVILSLIYLSYVVSGVAAHPDWGQVAYGAFVPQIVHDPAFLVTVVGLIGTTISPYMQFFLQSAVVDKGSRARELRRDSRRHRRRIRARDRVGRIHDHRQRRDDLSGDAPYRPAADQHRHRASARLRAAPCSRWRERSRRCCSPSASSTRGSSPPPCCRSRPPTSSARPSGSKRRSTAGSAKRRSSTRSSAGRSCSVRASSCSCPKASLFKLIFYAQVVQGIVLPLELVLMLIIINRPRVMGKYVNTPLANVVGWGTAVIIGVLALVYVWQSIASG
jgi:Mn2+/Fe2+ NRAMP family transporter